MTYEYNEEAFMAYFTVEQYVANLQEGFKRYQGFSAQESKVESQ